MLLTQTHLKYKDTDRQKVNGWENIYHMTHKHTKLGVATLMSYTTEFKAKSITRNKEIF